MLPNECRQRSVSPIVSDSELRRNVLARVAAGELSESYAAKLLSPSGIRRLRDRKMYLQVSHGELRELLYALGQVLSVSGLFAADVELALLHLKHDLELLAHPVERMQIAG